MSNWRDDEAASYIETYCEHGEDLALRVYTSRLLGRDASLVLHGGGNTSVKTRMKDELERELDVLCVKGSGWDLGDIEPPGLPAVALNPLQDFRALNALSDEDMVNGVRRNLLDAKSPNPSVETLLHAFLPHKYVDHSHADAVLVLANQPNAEALCREIYGSRMAMVPYIMPGFALAKKAAEVYEANPEVDGLILINHGIFTFGPTAKSSYTYHIEMVQRAKDAITKMAKSPVSFDMQPATRPTGNHALPLSILRGRINKHPEGPGDMVFEIRTSEAIQTWTAREDLADVSARGTITPDHVIRTKKKPLLLQAPNLQDVDAFSAQLDAALDAYVADYHAYFQKQISQKGVSRVELHPLPFVYLIEGIGLITAGRTLKAACIAADLYEHTIDTITKAERIGSFQPLNDADLFDMEYWSLEQAKLGKKKAKPMDGQVVLVTGATGGIGRATASAFAAQGANLCISDRDQEALDTFAAELRKSHGVGVEAGARDMTSQTEVQALVDSAVNRFGGLDVVVSNAGIAPTGMIAESTDLLQQSLAVNLLAHQYLSSAACAVMARQNTGGCLLYNASKSAFNPGPGFGAYSIPKAALIALMKQYAVEWADRGVRANAINADRIRTPLLDQEAVAQRAASRGLTTDQYFASNLLKQEVLAEDVAAAFVHLNQSKKTTGAILTVDGGNIAASPR